MSLETLSAFSTVLCSVALALLGYALGLVAPLPRPVLGHRGLARTRALTDAPVFAAIEPLVRFCGALCARLPLSTARVQLELRLVHAGDFLGLCADELIALVLLSSAACLLATSCLRAWTEISPLWQGLAVVLGAMLPFFSMRGETKRRQRRVARLLPPSIDLLALCMNAGLDFTGAIELTVRELQAGRDPLLVEYKRLLEELSLGRTRAQALASFAERVPVPAVRDFTAAVIQAEQKGSPLSEVLSIQAKMMRMRRSVLAEEAAAHASVLLVLPMMLLLAAVVLVMLGPFIVNGIGL
jgi:tight adherence protein C